jgi:HlyD family secretion protein
VRGSGTLVPERSVLVTTTTAGGRVERVVVPNGTAVQAGAVLVELRNPEVEQQAREAERELLKLEEQAIIEEVQQEQQRLNLAATLENVRTDFNEVQRLASIDDELLASGIISPAAAQRSRDRARDAARRLELEESRFELQTRNMEAQRRINEANLQRQREAANIQRERLQGLKIVAEIAGIVQDINLEIGQNIGQNATLGRIVEPDRLKAVLRVPEVQARDVAVGLRVEIDTRSGVVEGRVARIDPAAQSGTVAVDVVLEGLLPRGARPDLSVDGVIEIERLGEVLRMSRPVFAEADRSVRLFRLDPGGQTASRVDVRIGRTSVNAVEIAGGLVPGDVVILSDMSRWADYDKVRLR